MRNLQRRGVVLLTVIGLLALSGLASAQLGPEESAQPGGEEEPGDTVFNFGYDETYHLLAWNTSPTDPTEGTYDCTLDVAIFPIYFPIYGVDGASISVERLTTDGTEDVTFPPREGEAAPAPYPADGDCELNAAEVAGPNGQINHGMFMKLFNSLYQGQGRGCVNRYLAGSHLGKDHQQIRVSDVDVIADFEPVVNGATGEIVFSTFAADCEHGNNGNGHGSATADANGNVNGNGNGNGPEPASNKGGRPDSPGKSGDAPGHNK